MFAIIVHAVSECKGNVTERRYSMIRKNIMVWVVGFAKTLANVMCWDS